MFVTLVFLTSLKGVLSASRIWLIKEVLVFFFRQYKELQDSFFINKIEEAMKPMTNHKALK